LEFFLLLFVLFVVFLFLHGSKTGLGIKNKQGCH